MSIVGIGNTVDTIKLVWQQNEIQFQFLQYSVVAAIMAPCLLINDLPIQQLNKVSSISKPKMK